VVLRRGVEPRRAGVGGPPPVPPGEASGDLPASRTPCCELRRLAPRSAGQAVLEARGRIELPHSKVRSLGAGDPPDGPCWNRCPELQRRDGWWTDGESNPARDPCRGPPRPGAQPVMVDRRGNAPRWARVRGERAPLCSARETGPPRGIAPGDAALSKRCRHSLTRRGWWTLRAFLPALRSAEKAEPAFS